MRFSPTQFVGAAVLGLSLAIGGVALRSHDQAALDSALAVARGARRALQEEAARSAHADSIAALAQAQAAHLSAREQVFAANADKSSRALSALRARYALALAPDTCRSLKAAADSALAASDSVAASEHAARLAADDRAAFLQVGLDTTRDALAKLRSASVISAVATMRLEHAAKPPLLSRFFKALAPRIGVGISAGVDVHGAPDAVTGITLGWSF